jgi:hypothetical protein
VTPSNDGLSALFTPGTAGSTLITATVTQGPNGLSNGWQPGHLYRVGDQIIDQNGKVQKVTAANKLIPTTFTPYAGAVPNSVPMALSGGSASSTTHGIVNITSISATVPASWQVGDAITIAGATSTSINGQWVLTFVGTHAISFGGYTGTPLVSVSQTAGAVANTTRGGDFSNLTNEQAGADFVNGNSQFGTVLNQGDGTNGDWPAGAIAATSGNIKNPFPTTPAAVGFIGAGYSTGRNTAGVDNGPAGIDSPVPATAWQQVTPYSTGFRIVDSNGNIQQVELPGTSGTQYPHFSGSSTTVDGTVTWKFISSAVLGYSNSSLVRVAGYSEVGDHALGSFVLSGVTGTVSGSGVAVYAGTFPAAAGSNGFAGYVFTVAGFVTHLSNNGSFVCTASSTTSLTLTNAHAVTESASATAVNSGLRAYLDLESNVHVGWQVAGGSVIFAEPDQIPPAFASSGNTIDGDLVWTEQSTASLTTVYNNVTISVSTAAGILPVPYNYLVIS